VHSPGISIKNSLKGVSSSPDKPAESAETLEDPASGPSETTEDPASEPSGFDPEAVLEAWNDYALSLQKSKPRMHSTLTSNQPEISEKGSLSIRLNSEAQRDHFLKKIKSPLAEHIRRKTGLVHLEIIAEVAEGEKDEKKIYTEQDKLEFLIQKNPELGTLKSRFNLDFDD
jgi:hypothetical protein